MSRVVDNGSYSGVSHVTESKSNSCDSKSVSCDGKSDSCDEHRYIFRTQLTKLKLQNNNNSYTNIMNERDCDIITISDVIRAKSKG